MAIRNRVVQDSRTISRVGTRLNCTLVDAGQKHEAVIINLSLGGAFLSSQHLPSTGSNVTVILKPASSKTDLKLEGKVVRGGWALSDHGKLGRFGISFSHASLDLIKLISSLNKKG